MKNNEEMQLMVAPLAEVRRDFRKNLPWVIGLLVATVTYVLLSSALICAFENGWTFLHACYFTAINITTVGFGDVVPLTHGGKIIAAVNAFAGMLLLGVLIAVLALALQPSGWSATLSPSEGSSISEADARTYETNERPIPVENEVADCLEGIAKVLRAVENRSKVISREGRATIRIVAEGYSPHFVDVHISVRVS